MIRRAVVLLAIVLFAAIFIRIIGGYSELQALRPLASAYVTQVPADLNVPNVVTGPSVCPSGSPSVMAFESCLSS